MKRGFLLYMLSTFAMLVVFSVVTGCSRESSDDTVNISVVNSGMKIENESDVAIGYMAVEQGTAALIDWIVTCNDEYIIGSGAVRMVDTSQIIKWYQGCTAIVYFWQCPKSDDVKVYGKAVQF